jgi:hypothetical protein
MANNQEPNKNTVNFEGWTAGEIYQEMKERIAGERWKRIDEFTEEQPSANQDQLKEIVQRNIAEQKKREEENSEWKILASQRLKWLASDAGKKWLAKKKKADMKFSKRVLKQLKRFREQPKENEEERLRRIEENITEQKKQEEENREHYETLEKQREAWDASDTGKNWENEQKEAYEKFREDNYGDLCL